MQVPRSDRRQHHPFWPHSIIASIAPAPVSRVCHTYAKPEEFAETEKTNPGRLILVLLIPSYVFIGLALEHKSLDETQLSISRMLRVRVR